MVWIVRRPYTGLISAILGMDETEVVEALKDLGYVLEQANEEQGFEVGKVLPIFHE